MTRKANLLVLGTAMLALPALTSAQTATPTPNAATRPPAAATQPGTAPAQQPVPAPGQTSQPSGTTNPGRPGMASPQRPGDRAGDVQTTGTPASGANSFTEAQARSRMEDSGFSQVTGLRLDANGVWRGRATRGGNTEDVALDFRGVVYGGSAARAPAAASRTEGTQRPGNTAAPSR